MNQLIYRNKVWKDLKEDNIQKPFSVSNKDVTKVHYYHLITRPTFLTKPQFDAVNSAFERIFGLTNLCHLSAIIIKTSHYYVTHVHSDPLFLPPPTPVDIHHPGRAAMPWEGGGRLTLQMDPAGSSQRAVRRKWDTFQLSLHSPS